MANEMTAVKKAWSERFQLTDKLSMRPVDVKRLLGIEHVTINEAVLFLNKCKQYGADPFMNDMHMVKYSANSKAAIITGIGFFQKKAACNSRFEGYGKTEWLTDNGKWVDCWVPKIHGKYPLACRATCYIKGYKEAQTFSVNWDENVKLKNGLPNHTWGNMPSRMLEKNAKVALLREVLPNDLGGLYISEEITGDEAPVATVAPASVVLSDALEKVAENSQDHLNDKKKMEHFKDVVDKKWDDINVGQSHGEEKPEMNPTVEEIANDFGGEVETAPERSPDVATDNENPMPNFNDFHRVSPEMDESEIPF